MACAQVQHSTQMSAFTEIAEYESQQNDHQLYTRSQPPSPSSTSHTNPYLASSSVASSSASLPPTPLADFTTSSSLSVSHFLEALAQSSSRSALFLAVPLTQELCWELAEFVSSTPTLRVLTLSRASVGDGPLEILLPAISACGSLRTLDLPNNAITDAGASMLAECLRHNSTLTEVNLSGNSIGDAGAAALADALRHNTSLRVLHLAGNCITDDGCTSLGAGLVANQAISEVKVHPGNSISSQCAAQLKRSLRRNSRLMQVLHTFKQRK